MTDFTLTHFNSMHIHPFRPFLGSRYMHVSRPIIQLIAHVYTSFYIQYETIMSPLPTPSQQGYHVQTVKPLTFILQLPNSSVRCNCASHQPELGLLNCPHNHSFYYSIETTMSQLSPKLSFYYSNSQYVQSVSKALIFITCFCMSGLSAD